MKASSPDVPIDMRGWETASWSVANSGTLASGTLASGTLASGTLASVPTSSSVDAGSAKFLGDEHPGMKVKQQMGARMIARACRIVRPFVRAEVECVLFALSLEDNQV